MSEQTSGNFVLDSFAILAFFLDEPGKLKIWSYLNNAGHSRRVLYMNDINVGEVYYRVFKLKGSEIAELSLHYLLRLPISFVPIDQSFILSAARWKGMYPISYADAFAVETAVRYQAPILSGDPEFAKVKGVKVVTI